MIRIGEIVKNDKNPLMVVSREYEEIVKKLSMFNYSSEETKFLACLIISQTEHQYKKYLIRVLLRLKELNAIALTEDWQNARFEVENEELKSLFSDEEFNFMKDKDIEEDLSKYQIQYPSLLQDGLNDAFYHNKKKGMIILRRLITFYLKNNIPLSNLQKLTLYFVVAQLLDSWESSCIYLGLMILDGWTIDKMSEWFCATWLIYRST